ncbi:MAG: hypothetical protein V4613_00650 [Bacteroidota bacterium]
MDNNNIHIPSEIFDWINTKDFDALTEAQQQLVLEHLTKETYNELYENAFRIQEGLSLNQSPRHSKIKRNLIEQLENKQGSSMSLIRNFSNNTFWKAAAVVLIFISGWISHQLIHHQPLGNFPFMTITDTASMNQEIEKAFIGIKDSIAKDSQYYLKKFFDEKNRCTPDCDDPSLVPDNLNKINGKRIDTVFNRPPKYLPLIKHPISLEELSS